MTAFNREQFIVEAIESVIYNSYQNFELIIVDDCSKDNTVNVARNYEQSDSRVKVFINEKNLGDYPNRNLAATYAKGEYLLYVDSDDMLEKDTLEKLVFIIKDIPDFNFAMYCEHIKAHEYYQGNEALRNHFFLKQFLYKGPGNTFIRRVFFNEISGYPVKYGPANDMYFNLKVCCYSTILLLPFEFSYYRIHDGQEVNNHFSYLYNNYNYQKDALIELELPFSNKEIKWLIKKNKRRFVVNLFLYFKKTKSITKIFKAIRYAQFSISDAFVGVFH